MTASVPLSPSNDTNVWLVKQVSCEAMFPHPCLLHRLVLSLSLSFVRVVVLHLPILFSDLTDRACHEVPQSM